MALSTQSIPVHTYAQRISTKLVKRRLHTFELLGNDDALAQGKLLPL